MRMKPRQDTAVQELAKFALDEAGDFPIPFPLSGEEGLDVAMALLPIASQFLVSRYLGQVNFNRSGGISNLRFCSYSPT
jgi:hypothetical protein